MMQMLGLITGVEMVVGACAAAIVGMVLGKSRKDSRKNKPPEKHIEITVQRIDKPYRKYR